MDVFAVLDREIACEHVPGFIADQLAEVRDAVTDLVEALSFYTSVCGNTCAMVSRETAAEMYAKGTAALANIRSAS